MPCRGCVSTLESTAISNFIYFYTFHGLKQVAETRGQSPLQDLFFACIAGKRSINTFIPSRLQTCEENILFAALQVRNRLWPPADGVTRGQSPLQDLFFACIAGKRSINTFIPSRLQTCAGARFIDRTSSLLHCR